jgi:site-specific recombinase XerD
LGGRKRTVDLREVINSILYLNRTGCQWDMLPHDLLPKSTVYDYIAAGCAPTDHVFRNCRGQVLTRFGVHTVVERYAAVAASTLPALAHKHISPHTIRHTTAMHLLRADVNINNTIHAWLGHVFLNTTNV